jgi:acetyl esterase/lipase
MFEGVNHGFMQMSSELPEAMDAFRDVAAFVNSHFASR